MKEMYHKKNLMSILLIVIGCMAVGSFFDFQISSALYNQDSFFGQFFAAYGQLPVSMGLTIVGTLLIYVCEKRVKLTTILAFIGGVLAIFMGVAMSVMEPLMYLKSVPAPVSVVVTLLIQLLGNMLALDLARGTDKRIVKKWLGYFFFVIMVQMIIINIIKIPWGRPRMRMIAVTPEAVFQPWWVIGSNMKDHLMAMGVAAEEFKSFPSGHTACATCMIALASLFLINGKNNEKANLVFWGGVLFALVVAFSRIIMGAHFLTDVTVGFAVSFLINLVAFKFIFKI